VNFNIQFNLIKIMAKIKELAVNGIKRGEILPYENGGTTPDAVVNAGIAGAAEMSQVTPFNLVEYVLCLKREAELDAEGAPVYTLVRVAVKEFLQRGYVVMVEPQTTKVIRLSDIAVQLGISQNQLKERNLSVIESFGRTTDVENWYEKDQWFLDEATGYTYFGFKLGDRNQSIPHFHMHNVTAEEINFTLYFN
jgi:hypothetical protein